MPDLSYITETAPDRFDLGSTTTTMKAIVTTGNGGYDKLEYRDVPIPQLQSNEVLIRVLAAGMNNTEINTRLGWYSSSVTSGTEQFSETGSEVSIEDGGWNDKTPFPLIQGTDCCGVIEATSNCTSNLTVGQRVIVRACMRNNGYDCLDNIWMASDFDGAFAQYVRVPASEVFVINCDWSDGELATIPCAYGTAENMIHRARVKAGDRVLICGASGGVGSAAVQLCKRRGARVIARVGQSKRDEVAKLGIDQIIDRNADVIHELGESSVDVVIDNVAGVGFTALLKILARGGRYVSSGAIAGPMVEMDMRDFYLKDLNLIGCTAWDEPVFSNLVDYIERGEIQPLLAKTFPLKDIALAQQVFLKKEHVGNFVLIPPDIDE
ncbi:MAG: NADPH:quinone reductase-like Zn-dependent oxidoreductase [Gammaproteobacteria bacterium]|jgi:NADPH:quinone reductase-like Zn-dependent oxidoreductase